MPKKPGITLDYKYDELSKLSGVKDNVQSQINLINEKIDKICTLLNIEIEKENS